MAMRDLLKKDSILSLLDSPVFKSQLHAAITRTRRNNREYAFSIYEQAGEGRYVISNTIEGRRKSVPMPFYRDPGKQPVMFFHTHPKRGEQTPSPADFSLLEQMMLYSIKQKCKRKPIICVGKYTYLKHVRRHAICLVLAQRLKNASKKDVRRITQITKSLREWYGNTIPAEECAEFYKNHVRENYRIGLVGYYISNKKLQLWEYGGRIFPKNKSPIRLEKLLGEFE